MKPRLTEHPVLSGHKLHSLH